MGKSPCCKRPTQALQILAMQSASKLVGSSLSNLVHELSDFLQAQNEESTTTTPYSGSTAIAPRMRTVLLALLDECLDFRTGQDQHPPLVICVCGIDLMCGAGRERELASILNLVTMAVQKYPSVVCDNKCSAALAMLQRIIPMFAQEKIRQEQSSTISVIVYMLTSACLLVSSETFIQLCWGLSCL